MDVASLRRRGVLSEIYKRNPTYRTAFLSECDYVKYADAIGAARALEDCCPNYVEIFEDGSYEA
jgi:hypothetical protein